MTSVTEVKRSDLKFGDEIGEGGFSTVYLVTWNGQEAAAKKLNKVDRTELEIMSTLDHINIVKLLGVVDEKPEFYLILELCRKGSLRSYLDEHKDIKRLPTEQFYEWAKQIARPLEYLKKMGIVHKDVKSPNYLITEDDVLKLADFGLAKKIDITMSDATHTASYPWMAPELLKDSKLSPSYDIYSLGVVLWELWTMEMPFRGTEPIGIIWKVCNDNERPLIPVDCPKVLADLLRKCWEMDWHQRPSINHVICVINEAAVAAIEAEKKARRERILKGPWTFEKDLGKNEPGKLFYPVAIAVNTNDDIVVGDDSIVQVYSSRLEYKFSLDSTGLTPKSIFPLNVVISSEGNYAVTDKTKYVKMYGANGLYKGNWVVVSPQETASDPDDTCLWGLAIDTKDQLLVGEIRQKYISKHKQDGSHITSIEVRIEPRALAVTSQDTIVICDHEDSAQILDNAGQLLHIMRPPGNRQNWNPEGITFFEDTIFICNRERSDSQSDLGKGICCFSLSGDYLGLIPIQIAYPRHAAFTANGDCLIVSYGKCLGLSSRVKVFKLKA